MDTLSLPPAVERQVRCWCGNARLEGFSPDYWRCTECETLVVRAMRGEEISRVTDDERDFYGKNYYLHHIQDDYGLPDLETRARADLPERCLHWLRTLLKFVPGAGARVLELGCGHGGFVAMQRWAGLDATGLELSPWLVNRAREWFDVPVLEGRLEDQGLAAASWDAVILMDVLEHLPDPRQTLGQAVSLLRSTRGFLLIQTPCYPAGMSYEALCAEDHPFLTQLKPVEHLYLFSKPALQRLCAGLGVGELRFEPAIYAHYDLFAVASVYPLPERQSPEIAETLSAASPLGRAALAMLDLGEARDELSVRLAHAAAEFRDLQGHFDGSEADRAARLQVIENQGAEMGRLHAEVDRWRREAGELKQKIEKLAREHDQNAAKLTDLRGSLERSETERKRLVAESAATRSTPSGGLERPQPLQAAFEGRWAARLLEKLGVWRR